MEKLQQVLIKTFSYFFNDPYNVCFRKLLLISQQIDPQMAEIDRELFRDFPISVQTKIFTMLIDSDKFRPDDPHSVAVEFYGPVFMMFHTYDSIEDAMKSFKEHTNRFLKYHLAKGKE